MNNTVGIFLAAGFGTRLRPLTEKIPKPLALVNNKPILTYNLEASFDIVSEYILVISWLGDMIKKEYGDNFRGKKITYITQENPKGGTMDAFRQAVSLIQDKSNITGFLVGCADNLYSPNFYNLLKNEINSNPNGQYLLAQKYPNKNRLKEFGVMKVDQENNLLEMVEKPKEYVSDLISLGMYYFSNQVLSFIKNDYHRPNVPEEYITELISDMNQTNKFKVISSSDYFYSISNLDDLNMVNNIFSK